MENHKGLVHLPWELLHDGKCFLVEKMPPIIPVRLISNGQPIVTVSRPKIKSSQISFAYITAIAQLHPIVVQEEQHRQALFSACGVA
ncbi:hypothetical protein [Nostoc sp. UHCC 0252]|uniref:hypothetical protein n=1 Tax=Nostoc sp. UHCC 0252 TaxID=3110241 RepID=UPI002B216CAB|nr:hypothetical protein [Nostoc sp. UHCC 0252]MEA5601904.1 hypothetical protein [Nostoc sp. UHCC 0252]